MPSSFQIQTTFKKFKKPSTSKKTQQSTENKPLDPAPVATTSVKFGPVWNTNSCWLDVVITTLYPLWESNSDFFRDNMHQKPTQLLNIFVNQFENTTMNNSPTSITTARNTIRKELAERQPTVFGGTIFRAAADAMNSAFPQNVFDHTHNNPLPWFAMGVLYIPNYNNNDLSVRIQLSTTADLYNIASSLLIFDIDTTGPPLSTIPETIENAISPKKLYAAIVSRNNNHFIALIRNHNNQLYKYDGLHKSGQLIMQHQSIDQELQYTDRVTMLIYIDPTIFPTIILQ
jgi:hypothetical protein